MVQWNEADHPRDEQGKFTDKGEGNSTNNNATLEEKKEKTYNLNEVKGLTGNKEKSKEILSEEENRAKMQRRAEILYTTMKDKIKNRNGVFTGAAANIVTDEIAGVKKGNPMSLDEAMESANPDYDVFGNLTYKENCQAAVTVAEARVRGFDIETSIDYGSDLKEELSRHPNYAYIDPKTGRTPRFEEINVSDPTECEKALNDTIKQGERYIFQFDWKQKDSNGRTMGHILIAVKNENNKTIFYDPQRNYKYEKASILLERIQYKTRQNKALYPPEILRVDDKELDYKVLNQISKPARKKKQ